MFLLCLRVCFCFRCPCCCSSLLLVLISPSRRSRFLRSCASWRTQRSRAMEKRVFGGGGGDVCECECWVWVGCRVWWAGGHLPDCGEVEAVVVVVVVTVAVVAWGGGCGCGGCGYCGCGGVGCRSLALCTRHLCTGVGVAWGWCRCLPLFLKCLALERLELAERVAKTIQLGGKGWGGSWG